MLVQRDNADRYVLPISAYEMLVKIVNERRAQGSQLKKTVLDVDAFTRKASPRFPKVARL
jgi:hypothetical protein